VNQFIRSHRSAKNNTDLYPEIRLLAKAKNAAEKHNDMVRFDYIDKLGYYCTESSEHNAEYSIINSPPFLLP